MTDDEKPKSIFRIPEKHEILYNKGDKRRLVGDQTIWQELTNEKKFIIAVVLIILVMVCTVQFIFLKTDACDNYCKDWGYDVNLGATLWHNTTQNYTKVSSIHNGLIECWCANLKNNTS